MISTIQHFEADFLWKVSLKILNSGIILKTFTHGDITWAVFCLFDLILYIPVKNFLQLCPEGSSWVEPVLSKG